ncbi:MAG: hypothetical protein LC754_07750 [Acidobacteria bacterium]|nr:hypothetical protein [Acidobacteriota bacterium]
MSLKGSHKEWIILGAINGILFGMLLELIFRSIFLYEKYVQRQSPISPGLHIDMAPYPFSWWYLPVLFLVLVTLASLLVHRYLSSHIKSRIWLWQVIGFAAVLECCLYAAILSWYHWYRGFAFLGVADLVQAMESGLKTCLLFLPVALVFNLLFAVGLRFRKVELP